MQVIKTFQTQSLDCLPVRLRSCQLLNKVIDKLVDRDVDVSYELFEDLQEAMLERIWVIIAPVWEVPCNKFSITVSVYS